MSQRSELGREYRKLVALVVFVGVFGLVAFVAGVLLILLSCQPFDCPDGRPWRILGLIAVGAASVIPFLALSSKADEIKRDPRDPPWPRRHKGDFF
jgi:hypothetical protein